MTGLTTRSRRHATRTRKCGQHPRYTPGCRGCQQRNRAHEAARYKAVVLGTHRPGFVPAAGTARRLQGLTAEGHPARDLAQHLDVAVSTVKQWRVHETLTVARHTHDAVRILVTRLDSGGTSAKARSYAVRQGWVPVAAWDDIDDPDAAPAAGSLTEAIPERPASLRYVRWALGGRWPIGRLTVSEQTHLYQLWCQQEQQAGRRSGRKPFARAYGTTEWQARRVADLAAVTR